jgi:hypothetical protein
MPIGSSGVVNYVNTTSGLAEHVIASADGVGASGVATLYSSVALKITTEGGAYLVTEASARLITEQSS